MKTETIKGFKDFVGEDAEKKKEIEKIIIESLEKYGFESTETPIIEYEEFVKGNNSEDETISDIFKLRDKGKRKLALRYEFTFQLKRLMKNKKLPWKRYQLGPVFRDEPVSKNRLRQFTQCDIDIIGTSSSPAKEESEILALAYETLKKLKVNPIILVNNRKLLDEIMDDLKIKEKDKEQTLREIDKYDKLPEKEIKKNLKKLNAEKIIDNLKKGEEYFKKFESYKEIISLMDYCRTYKIEIKFSPTITRGFSYYGGTVFEIKARGIKETITAGGSYTFNKTPCTGISFGIERISAVSKIKTEKEKYLLVSLRQERESIKIAQKLRQKNKPVSIFYGKPSKALEYANAYKFSKVIFVGEKEIQDKKFKVKDMKTGKETKLEI